MKYKVLLIVALLGIISFYGFGKLNPQCQAIAKSTGMQYRNHVWADCPYPYCYNHCK